MDLSRMVPAMPGVVAQSRDQAYGLTGLGVEEGSGKLLFGHRAQELDPASVQPLQKGERRPDVAGARILQRGPAAFVVGFDRRHFFGQRPLEADVAVDM